MDSWVWVFGITEVMRPVDDVLPVVIDTDLTVGSKRRLTGSRNRPGGHQRATASSGLPKAKFSGGVNNDVDAFSINVEFLSGNLKCHGVNPP